jgi:hypothetical protein
LLPFPASNPENTPRDNGRQPQILQYHERGKHLKRGNDGELGLCPNAKENDRANEADNTYPVLPAKKSKAGETQGVFSATLRASYGRTNITYSSAWQSHIVLCAVSDKSSTPLILSAPSRPA